MKQKIALIATGIFGLAMTSQAALVAHYQFDELAGATTAANAVTGGTAGAIGSGVTTGIAGIAGNAYSFPGTSPAAQANVVDMGNADFLASFAVTRQLTFSAWIFTEDVTGNRNTVIFAGDDSTNNSFTDMGVAASQPSHLGEASARHRPSTTPGSHAQTTGIFSTGVVVNDGAWNHLVMTVDLADSNAQLALYINGVLAESSTLTYAAFPNYNNFEIGRLARRNNGAFSPVDPYQGLIDDVQVYDHALSASEVLFLHNNPGVAVPEPSAFALAGLGVLSLFRRKRA